METENKSYRNRKEYSKQYREKNAEKIKQRREANKEKNKQYQKRYNEVNKEKSKKYCKENKERLAEKAKERYLKNRDKILEYQKQYNIDNTEKHREYRIRNSEHINEKRKKWVADNPERRKDYEHQYNRGKRRNRNLKDLYGITREEHDEMFDKQKGCCAICNKPNMVLSVDHNHTTGKVRGLLCNKCNFALGNANDNPDILLKAIEYLKTHNEAMSTILN